MLVIHAAGCGSAIARFLPVPPPVSPQDQIEALGPYGPLLFVVTVMITEMIPLFPTQPLSLASGLLFGPQKARAPSPIYHILQLSAMAARCHAGNRVLHVR